MITVLVAWDEEESPEATEEVGPEDVDEAAGPELEEEEGMLTVPDEEVNGRQ